MLRTLIASAAFVASTALAQGVGSAIVINQCSYDVALTNVPASGGGFTQIGPNTLTSGGSYSQIYTELGNSDGWSIKLSKSDSMSQVMQFEYTFHDDGIVWFDMSDVNGDPWGGDWEFTGSGDCNPKQTAYQYSTDDAYGMQSCPDTSSVTVTLCSSGGTGGTSSGGLGSSASAESSPAAYTPTTSAYSAPSSTKHHHSSQSFGTGVLGANLALSSSLTTFTTAIASADKTVTNMHTVVVTEYVTMSPSPVAKRYEAQHRHAVHHEH